MNDTHQTLHRLRYMNAALQWIAEELLVEVSDLIGPSRRHSIVRPRFAAIWLLRRRYGHSMEELGIFFGNRHYTTIIHAIEEINRARANDPVYALTLDTLYTKLCQAVPIGAPQAPRAAARTTLAQHVAWVLHVGRTQLGSLPPRRDPLHRREWLKREVG